MEDRLQGYLNILERSANRVQEYQRIVVEKSEGVEEESKKKKK